MNRRNTLKNLLLASGGLVALPAWANAWTIDNLHFNSSFSLSEQSILSSLVEAIIPAGNSLGALSVGVDKFLLKLIEKCYEKEVQENVQKQLQALEKLAQSTHNQSFINCTLAQKQTLFLTYAKSENKTDKDFFELIKSETIRGFRTSKEVMTTYLKYQVMPGHYHGCVDINQ